MSIFYFSTAKIVITRKPDFKKNIQLQLQSLSILFLAKCMLSLKILRQYVNYIDSSAHLIIRVDKNRYNFGTTGSI